MIDRQRVEPLELDDQTHLWLVTCDATTTEDLERWRATLSLDETTRLASMTVESARQQFVTGRGLARETLSRYASVEPAAWRFVDGPKGRPEIDAPPAGAHLRFNLSHTRGFVACVVAARRAVGVDVQQLDRRHALQRLAVRRFHPQEAELFATLADDAELARRFYEHWTLKEALVKALGADLATSLRRFAIRIEGDRASFIDSRNREHPNSWRLHLYALGDDHLLAVADAAAGGGPIRSFAWQPSSGDDPTPRALELAPLLGSP